MLYASALTFDFFPQIQGIITSYTCRPIENASPTFTEIMHIKKIWNLKYFSKKCEFNCEVSEVDTRSCQS